MEKNFQHNFSCIACHYSLCLEIVHSKEEPCSTHTQKCSLESMKNDCFIKFSFLLTYIPISCIASSSMEIEKSFVGD